MKVVMLFWQFIPLSKLFSLFCLFFCQRQLLKLCFFWNYAIVMTISTHCFYAWKQTHNYRAWDFFVSWHFDFFVNALMPLLCGITKASVPYHREMTWLMSFGTKLMNKTVLATKCLEIVLRNAHILLENSTIF